MIFRFGIIASCQGLIPIIKAGFEHVYQTLMDAIRLIEKSQNFSLKMI